MLTSAPVSESMVSAEDAGHIVPREGHDTNGNDLNASVSEIKIIKLLITPGTSVTILVNLTNEGNSTEQVNLSIVSISGWGLDWTRNGTPKEEIIKI